MLRQNSFERIKAKKLKRKRRKKGQMEDWRREIREKNKRIDKRKNQ